MDVYHLKLCGAHTRGERRTSTKELPTEREPTSFFDLKQLPRQAVL